MWEKIEHNFLASLSKDLDEVGSKILGIHRLHKIKEAFVEVRRKENRWRIIFEGVESNFITKEYAIANRSMEQDPEHDLRRGKR